MRELKKEEMKQAYGGASISATMLGAVYKIIETIFNLGDSLGSYIRRVHEDKMCDL